MLLDSIHSYRSIKCFILRKYLGAALLESPFLPLRHVQGSGIPFQLREVRPLHRSNREGHASSGGSALVSRNPPVGMEFQESRRLVMVFHEMLRFFSTKLHGSRRPMRGALPVKAPPLPWAA